MAGPRADLAVRLLPVLDQRRRPGRGSLPALLHLPAPGGDRGARRRDRAAAGGAGRPATAGRRSSPPRCTGRTRPRAWRRPAGPCSARETSPASTPPRWAPRCARRRTTSVSGPLPAVTDLLALTGLRLEQVAARRTVAEGGAYVNNERVTDPDAVAPRTCCTGGGWCSAGASATSPASRVRIGAAARTRFDAPERDVCSLVTSRTASRTRQRPGRRPPDPLSTGRASAVRN